MCSDPWQPPVGCIADGFDKPAGLGLSLLLIAGHFAPVLNDEPVRAQGWVCGDVSSPQGLKTSELDEVFEVVRPALLRIPPVLENHLRTSRHINQDARFQRALDGVAGEG